MSKALVLQIIFKLMEMCGFETIGILKLLSTFLMSLPNSRMCETEADEIGFELLLKACFNPEEAPKTFARMQKAKEELMGHSNAAVETYFSTHPADESRIQSFVEKMPQARERYINGNCEEKRKAWFASAQDYYNKA